MRFKINDTISSVISGVDRYINQPEVKASPTREPINIQENIKPNEKEKQKIKINPAKSTHHAQKRSSSVKGQRDITHSTRYLFLEETQRRDEARESRQQLYSETVSSVAFPILPRVYSGFGIF